VIENNFSWFSMNVMCSFGPIFSVLELVDAAIPAQELDPIKQTILQTESVKVSFKNVFWLYFELFIQLLEKLSILL
jgi:hypothetical protein